MEKLYQADIPDKRSVILKTTLKLISERGFHNTPMSLIVKKSGVSTGIVYHYFSDKDKLIKELYREIKTRTLKTLIRAYDRYAPDKERFTKLWKSGLKYYLEHPEEIKFLEQYERSPYFDHETRESIHRELNTEDIFLFFKEGINRKELKNLPADILMNMGMSTAFILAEGHIQGTLEITDEIADIAANASWDMIKR